MINDEAPLRALGGGQLEWAKYSIVLPTLGASISQNVQPEDKGFQAAISKHLRSETPNE